MNLGGREVENRGDAEGNEAKGLKMREGSPLEIMIGTDEKGGRGEACVEGRKWPVIWTMNELA